MPEENATPFDLKLKIEEGLQDVAQRFVEYAPQIVGALVPILLKRFGLDPAQSSSIVLTTVTDIAGFLSFLGIATLLSGMLAAN